MKRYLYRFDLPILTLAFIALALSACEMTSQSRMSTAPIEVQHSRHTESFAAGVLKEEQARAIARHYDRFGEGPVEVTATYRAGSDGAHARREAARVADVLRRMELRDVTTSTLPLNDPKKSDLVTVSYGQLTAQGPRGCTLHPAETREGLVANADGRFADYRLGCAMDQMMAQQIVRPRDLLGDSTLDSASGDRAATRLEDYRTGKDTKALTGEDASTAN